MQQVQKRVRGTEAEVEVRLTEQGGKKDKDEDENEEGGDKRRGKAKGTHERIIVRLAAIEVGRRERGVAVIDLVDPCSLE